MASIIYSNGNKTVAVPANEKIAVFSFSPVQVYQQVGYPNFPNSWELLYTTTDGESYVSSAFAAGATIRLEASAADAFYETGSAPSISEPQTDITAADATFTISGLSAAQGGYVATTGGTSTTSGNAGGAVTQTGGTPGATGVGGAVGMTGGAGGSTSGKGGAASVVGGAGTAGNGSGGSVILAAGAKHGSGVAGGIFARSSTAQIFFQQTAPVAKSGAAAVTIAEMLNGIIVHTCTTGVALTTPTGAAMSAGCPTDLAAGDSFHFYLRTIGTGADDIVTLTAGDGAVTFTGDVTVGPDLDGTGIQYGHWIFRLVSAGVWVGDRVG